MSSRRMKLVMKLLFYYELLNIYLRLNVDTSMIHHENRESHLHDIIQTG